MSDLVSVTEEALYVEEEPYEGDESPRLKIFQKNLMQIEK